MDVVKRQMQSEIGSTYLPQRVLLRNKTVFQFAGQHDTGRYRRYESYDDNEEAEKPLLGTESSSDCKKRTSQINTR